MKRNCLILFYLFCFISVSGQNKLTLFPTDSLLQAIAKLQSSGDSFYHQGMFPSQRGKHKRKEDDNIFYTTAITFTLQNLNDELPLKEQHLKDSICRYTTPNYSFYKNSTGITTFNFWQTKPPKFFPNSKFLSHHKFFNVPDDADCSALIFLTDVTLKDESRWLKTQLANHANLTTSKIKSTYHKYRKYKAYSTWFGKKMPIEFDICVQSNILYFVYENRLPLNANDTATISLIKAMILSGDYLKYSYFVSPAYKKHALVLYHLSRLLGKFKIDELEDCRAIIKKDIEVELTKKNSFMENIILSTALIRMGGSPKLLIEPKNLENELQNFVFFEADLFSPYARPALKFVSRSNVYAIPFHCKAYSLALLFEYEILKNNRN